MVLWKMNTLTVDIPVSIIKRKHGGPVKSKSQKSKSQAFFVIFAFREGLITKNKLL